MSSIGLLTSFHDMLDARYPKDGVGMSYSQWIVQNTKLRDRQYSFRGYEFQQAIADDMHPNLWVIKPSQVGLTEIQIRKMLAFLARNRGTSAIYTLPNEKMFKRLSKTRVKPLVDTERAFSSFTDDEAKSRSMDLYEINGSFAYFTGMTEGDATSIPADYLLHDEIDLSDQVNIGLFQSRLQNSKYRITHRFSTPTLPGFAIDAGFNSSDQHEYMCKCPGCNHWQIPMFSTKFLRMPGYVGGEKLLEMTEEQYHAINTDRIEVVCEHCARPLDLLNPELREWVARHPGRKSRGYRIRPFMNEALMPAYILGQLFEMRRLNNIRGFYNTVLGEPYSDGTNQLTEDAIKACLKGAAIPEIGKETPVVVGIDVGLICSVIFGTPVGTVVQPFRFEQVRAEELIEFVKSAMEQYNIVGGAIDRYPYTPTADAVYLASGKKIVPVEYRPGPFVNIKRDEFDEISYVQVNRTGAIDRVANLVNKRILQMRGYTQHEETIVAHLQDMVRIEAAEKDASWEKLTGNDHFFHAMGYLQASVRIAEIIHSLSQNGTEDIRTEVGIFGLKSGKASSEPGLFRTRQTETADIY